MLSQKEQYYFRYYMNEMAHMAKFANAKNIDKQ